jgi:hypothetical protein
MRASNSCGNFKSPITLMAAVALHEDCTGSLDKESEQDEKLFSVKKCRTDESQELRCFVALASDTICSVNGSLCTRPTFYLKSYNAPIFKRGKIK